VGNALAAQNQIVPVGDIKIGHDDYTVQLNDSPTAIEELNNLPIKTVNGATITIGQVAHVRDGSPPQQNIVRVDGHRAVLMSALKNGNASTLALVEDQATRRPIGVRESRRNLGGARGRHRRVSDFGDDPGVSGKLALDGDHCGIDSARRAFRYCVASRNGTNA
jgi:hypothetical protein